MKNDDSKKNKRKRRRLEKGRIRKALQDENRQHREQIQALEINQSSTNIFGIS